LADLVPWLFLVAQIIHSIVFENAGAIHAYWTYHAGPALALGGAIILTDWGRAAATAVERLARRATRPERVRTVRAAGLALIGGAFAVMVLAQAAYAIDQHRWGYDTGRAAYSYPYHDEYYETRWAEAVGQ